MSSSAAYGVCVALAFLVAFAVKRAEERRLGYGRSPGYRWVGLGALGGAVVGAKVGMLLYVPFEEWLTLLGELASLRFDGKTVLGGLAGGYLGVEGAKRLAGVRHSTGDAFAVAIPLGQAVGRVGCTLAGCCHGAPTDVPWAVEVAGVLRHPAPLYEAGLDVLLALALFAVRKAERPQGHLFRYFLVGYACIRFALDPLRGDAKVWVGPLSLAQLFCLAVAAAFLLSLRRRPGAAPALG
jgi:phosphatidylglycerol:prolipoprotein diacylglycerol transferase